MGMDGLMVVSSGGVEFVEGAGVAATVAAEPGAEAGSLADGG